MKKTISINISGIIFNIEEDAYNKLKLYLSTIKGYFNNSESQEEILEDIESRIAELFSDRVNDRKQVVTESDVRDIISIMGEPEDYLGDEDEETQGRRFQSGQNFTDKKFFRDKEEGIFGGVCYGIAAYFGFDVVWVRIITAIITLTGPGILPYIILWVIIPEAKSTSDKLRMHGDPVDIDSIKKKVDEGLVVFQNEAKHLGKKAQNNNIGSLISGIVDGILKVLKVFFGFIGGFVGVAFLLIGLFFSMLFIGLFLNAPTIFGDLGIYPLTIHQILAGTFDTSLHSSMFLMGIVLAIGIPILAIILVGVRLIFQYKIPFKGVTASLVTGWIIGIFLMISATINIKSEFATYDESNSNIAIETVSDTLYVGLAGLPMITDKIQINGIRIHDIDRNSGMVTGGNVHLDVERSPAGGNYKLEMIKSSYGENYDDTSFRMENIEVDYEVVGNRLEINPRYKFPFDDKIRGQEVTFILRIPEDKHVIFEDKTHLILDHVKDHRGRSHRHLKDKILRMTEEGLSDLDDVLEELGKDIDDIQEEIDRDINDIQEEIEKDLEDLKEDAQIQININ